MWILYTIEERQRHQAGIWLQAQLWRWRESWGWRGKPPHLEVDDDQEDDNGGHQLGDVGERAPVEGLLQRPHLHEHTLPLHNPAPCTSQLAMQPALWISPRPTATGTSPAAEAPGTAESWPAKHHRMAPRTRFQGIRDGVPVRVSEPILVLMTPAIPTRLQ